MIFKRNSKPDRRRRQRQLLNTRVEVLADFGHVNALGINISDVGMRLFAVAHLPLGAQIQLEYLPPHCTERVRAQGIVRHRALYLYGIEFLTDSDQHDWVDAGTITNYQAT